jgi:hypothetical protein
MALNIINATTNRMATNIRLSYPVELVSGIE